jgi:tetratricopeptide (TPR) repeat protein
MIMQKPFPENSNYRSEIRALLRLHRLWVEGKGESPEADAVRDATDGHWELLSEVERKRVRGLSEDLNSIEDQESYQRAAERNPHVRTKLAEVYEARQRGDWDRALALLRTLEKEAPPALVSYLRGSIWLEAGDPEVAVTFIAHATRLEPDNTSYHALVSGTEATSFLPINVNVP